MVSSEEFLNGKAAEQWNVVVGTWVGAELEPGTPVRYTVKEPIPALSGEEVLMNYTFEVRGTRACERSGEPRTCADVVLHSEPDAEDVQRLLQSFVERLDAGAASLLALSRFRADYTLTLTTEPDGLIPHAYASRREIHVTGRVDDREQVLSQVEEIRSVFTYP